MIVLIAQHEPREAGGRNICYEIRWRLLVQPVDTIFGHIELNRCRNYTGTGAGRRASVFDMKHSTRILSQVVIQDCFQNRYVESN